VTSIEALGSASVVPEEARQTLREDRPVAVHFLIRFRFVDGIIGIC
jgi:hypothetical protein